MDMKQKFLLLCIILGMSSCKIGKQITINGHYPPKESVQMLSLGQSLPDNLYRIGSITVGDGGLTPAEDCTYEMCLLTIEKEAAKVGADVAHIVSVTAPTATTTVGIALTNRGSVVSSGTSGSECYTVIADLFIYNEQGR